MSNYLDTNSEQDKKEATFKFVQNNTDKLKMTPEEEYNFNWGPGAVSSSWLDSKAKEITADIQKSNSTEILRRGLAKDDSVTSTTDAKDDTKTDEKTAEEIEAEKAKAEKAKAVTERNGGDHDFGAPSPIGTTTEQDAGAKAARESLGWMDLFGVLKNPFIGIPSVIGKVAHANAAGQEAAANKSQDQRETANRERAAQNQRDADAAARGEGPADTAREDANRDRAAAREDAAQKEGYLNGDFGG